VKLAGTNWCKLSQQSEHQLVPLALLLSSARQRQGWLPIKVHPCHINHTKKRETREQEERVKESNPMKL